MFKLSHRHLQLTNLFHQLGKPLAERNRVLRILKAIMRLPLKPLFYGQQTRLNQTQGLIHKRLTIIELAKVIQNIRNGNLFRHGAASPVTQRQAAFYAVKTQLKVCYLLTLQVHRLEISTRNGSMRLIICLNFFERLFKGGKARLQILHMLKQQFVGDVFGHGWSSRAKGFSLHICALLMALSTFAAPNIAVAETAKPEDMLRFIRHFEARGSYDRYYSGIKVPPPKPLTQLTVGEVLTWQKSLRGSKSTASGAYQFIRPTLERLVRKYRISRSQLFDDQLQDQLAQLLISECPHRNLPKDNLRFGNCLATIWAALPVLSGAKKGQSHYQGVAGNRALTTPQNVLAMLSGGEVSYEVTPFKTPSPKWPIPYNKTVTDWITTQKFDRGDDITFSLSGPTRKQRITKSIKDAQTQGGLGKSIHTTYKVDPYAAN